MRLFVHRLLVVLVGSLCCLAAEGASFADMVDVAGGGEPYHKAKHAFLRSDVLSFDRAQRDKVMAAIEKGDYDALVKLPRRDVSALAVLAYALPDGTFAAVQAFEYAELEYRPICGVKILTK